MLTNYKPNTCPTRPSLTHFCHTVFLSLFLKCLCLKKKCSNTKITKSQMAILVMLNRIIIQCPVFSIFTLYIQISQQKKLDIKMTNISGFLISSQSAAEAATTPSKTTSTKQTKALKKDFN